MCGCERVVVVVVVVVDIVALVVVVVVVFPCCFSAVKCAVISVYFLHIFTLCTYPESLNKTFI